MQINILNQFFLFINSILDYDCQKKNCRYYMLIRIENIKEVLVFYNYVTHNIDEIINWNQKDHRNYYDINILCKKENYIKLIEYLNGKVLSEKNDELIIALYLPQDKIFWFSKDKRNLLKSDRKNMRATIF